MPRFLAQGSTTPIGTTGMQAGIRSESGLYLPAAGNVAAYVGASSAYESLLTPAQRSIMVPTLNAALRRVRSGKGDVVMVMPDHAENISSADQMSNLVAGTRILGMGAGQLKPTFTWTAATASFLLDVANVTLDGLLLEMAPAANSGVTVAAPITVSGAGCAITNCRINFGADANDIVGQAINTTAAADDFVFANNRCFGATAAECETFLNLIGTDRIQIVNNYIAGATSAATVGLIRAETTAHLDGLIYNNVVINRLATSAEAITLMNGCTGFMDYNHMQVLDTSSTAMDNDGDYLLGQNNFVANTAGERGAGPLGTQSA